MKGIGCLLIWRATPIFISSVWSKSLRNSDKLVSETEFESGISWMWRGADEGRQSLECILLAQSDFTGVYRHRMEPGHSAVRIVTELWPDEGRRSLQFRLEATDWQCLFWQSVQTVSRAHATSCSMGTGICFPWGKADRACSWQSTAEVRNE